MRPKRLGNRWISGNGAGRLRCVCRGQAAHPGWSGTFGTGVEEAHNPEVAGSNPAPATQVRRPVNITVTGLLLCATITRPSHRRVRTGSVAATGGRGSPSVRLV